MAPRKKKAAATGGSVIDSEKFEYETTKVRDKSGKLKYSKNNGDAIAKAMTVFLSTGKDIMQVVRANKLTERMKGRDGLNAGLFRMTLGVMLRAMVKRGEPVQIGDITVKTLEQRVAVPEAKVKAPAAARAPRATKAGGRKRRVKAAVQEAA